MNQGPRQYDYSRLQPPRLLAEAVVPCCQQTLSLHRDRDRGTIGSTDATADVGDTLSREANHPRQGEFAKATVSRRKRAEGPG